MGTYKTPLRAYSEIYLSKSQSLLGCCFDCAINVFGLDGESFFRTFALCDSAKRIELGDPSEILGQSGIELAMSIFKKEMGRQIDPVDAGRLDRTPEYWMGWAMAYCQWYLDRPFCEIMQAVGYTEMQDLYPTMHEMSIDHFVDHVCKKLKMHSVTKLKHYRMMRGLSQSELARESGVGLRSIQMYEQRKKDINRASAETLYRLSKVLGCDMASLLER